MSTTCTAWARHVDPFDILEGCRGLLGEGAGPYVTMGGDTSEDWKDAESCGQDTVGRQPTARAWGRNVLSQEG